MWDAIFVVSFLLTFVAPIPFLPIAIFAWIKAGQADENKRTLTVKRNKVLANVDAVAPTCSACGSVRMVSSGAGTAIPAQGVRSFQFPLEGMVLVRRYTCIDCSISARYGLAQAWPENGWIMLDRYMGGW